MKPSHFYLLLLFFVSWHSSAQKADSLLRVFGYPKNDTAGVLALYDAAYELEQSYPQTALAIYQKGASWSKTIGYNNGVGKGHNYTGIVWFSMGEIDSALANARLSLPYFDQAGNRRSYAASLNNIGNCYNVWNDTPEAIRYYQEANAIYEKLGEGENRISNLNNIGTLLTRSGNYDQAETYLKDALEQAQRLNFIAGLADVNMNLGMLEETRLQYGEALIFFQDAATHYRALAEAPYLANAHSNMGWCYNMLGNYDQALTELQVAERLLDTFNLPREKANLAANFSAVYANLDNYRRARQVASEALPTAEAVGDFVLQKRILEQLAVSCEKLGDFAAAATYYRRLAEVSRQIFDTEKNNRLLTLERQYETEKKERRILEQQLNIQRQNTQKRLMLILFSLLLAAALVGLLWFRSRLRYNRRIAAQEAELQNRRIREMEQEQKLLAAGAMLDGQEEERKRIAKDLHDGLGGLLSTIKLHFNAVQEQVRQLEALQAYQRAGEMIDSACEEVRRISHNMMPGALAKLGLIAAVEDLVEDLRRASKLDISIQTQQWASRLDEAREAMLFRIVQELLYNAVKHAEASRIAVQLVHSDQMVTLTVEDNGKGFDPEQAKLTGGLGLKSIASRVHYLGGSVQFNSVAGKGTSVIVKVREA
jgi:two-component system NarL family sensor kinase